MANLPNLSGNTNADYIANEATPGLKIQNLGTGPGLRVMGQVLTSGASIDSIFGNPAITSNATAVNVAQFTRTVIGSPSVALNMWSVSGPSIPVFEFQANALVSCSTILFTTGGAAGTMAIRVKYSDGVTYGWIPVMPNSAVTAAAI